MSAAATEETVDLGVDLDAPIPCGGVSYKHLGIEGEDCDLPAEFRLTLRHCKTWTKHRCGRHVSLYLGGFVCTDCMRASHDVTVRPL